jgi:hypothetical protein
MKAKVGMRISKKNGLVQSTKLAGIGQSSQRGSGAIGEKESERGNEQTYQNNCLEAASAQS